MLLLMNNIGSIIKGNLTVESYIDTTNVGDGSINLESKLSYLDSNNNNNLSISSRSITSSYSLTLPGAFPGATRNVLVADTNGDFNWETSTTPFTQVFNGAVPLAETSYYTFKGTSDSTGRVTFNALDNTNSPIFNSIINVSASAVLDTNLPSKAPVCSIKEINNPSIVVQVLSFPKLVFDNFGQYYTTEIQEGVEVFITVIGTPVNPMGSVYYGPSIIADPKCYVYTALTQNGRAIFYLTSNNASNGTNLFSSIHSISTSAIKNTIAPNKSIITSINSENNPEIIVNVFMIPTIIADNFGQFTPEIAPDNTQVQITVIAS